MLGVLPFVMTSCQEEEIPPLWRKLHGYDAPKGYEATHDGLLHAIGLQELPLSPQEGPPAPEVLSAPSGAVSSPIPSSEPQRTRTCAIV